MKDDKKKEIHGVDALESDPSIWKTSAAPFSYRSCHYRKVKKVYLPQEVPRGYLRIIPVAGWKNGIPKVEVIENLPWLERVVAVESRDYGRCEEGFVDIRIVGGVAKLEDEEPPVGGNASMWFENTGEYWVIHGSAVRFNSTEEKRPLSLYYVPLIMGWDKALRAAMKAFDSLGALPERKVEVGLVKIKDARLRDEDFREELPDTYKNEIVVSGLQDNWDDEAQRAFLHDAFNEIRDCYGLYPLNRADFEVKARLSRFSR